MSDQTIYNVPATFRVRAGSHKWAAINLMAALADLDREPLVSFSLGEIPLSRKEPEEGIPDPVGVPRRGVRLVDSFSEPDITYVVTTANGYPVACTCPDFIYRVGAAGGDCKHMRAVL